MMKQRPLLAALICLTMASSALADRPIVGKFVPDLKALQKQMAKASFSMTLNGIPQKLSPKQRSAAVGALLRLYDGFSVDIKKDGTYDLTMIFGTVHGTWKMDGQRLVATPHSAQAKGMWSINKTSPFTLVRQGSTVLLKVDADRNHSLSLIRAKN